MFYYDFTDIFRRSKHQYSRERVPTADWTIYLYFVYLQHIRRILVDEYWSPVRARGGGVLSRECVLRIPSVIVKDD